MAKLKILKTGETDIESTDIWRFCMHSDYPTQKIYASGQTTLTISAGNDTGTKTISHGLGYAPIVMAMFEVSTGRFAKILGETKASLSTEVRQFWAIDTINNCIAKYEVLSDAFGSLVNTTVSVNDIIRFGTDNGASLPTPLQPNTDYYVRQIQSRTYFGTTITVFTVALTQGGAEIDITDTGGASNYSFFKNITSPYIIDNAGTYKIKTTSTNVIFEFNPTVSTFPLAADKNITIYYIILYDEI